MCGCAYDASSGWKMDMLVQGWITIIVLNRGVPGRRDEEIRLNDLNSEALQEECNCGFSHMTRYVPHSSASLALPIQDAMLAAFGTIVHLCV
jgi:hypothetical protein